MNPSPSRRAGGGFTLIEVAVGLVIMGLAAAGMVMVLSKQSEQRKLTETRVALAGARDALLAYVAAHGRLPCPAIAGSNGQESRVAPGSPQCTAPAGLLPAVTLGLAQLDPNGLLLDGFADGTLIAGVPARAVRYAVPALAPTAANALTATGLGNPTLAGRQAALAAVNANEAWFVCRSATGLTGAGNRCGNAANTLSSNAVAVVWSTGANGSSAAAWSVDEVQNANLATGNVVISREQMPAGATGGAFDDQVVWIPFPMVIDRLLTAGHVQ